MSWLPSGHVNPFNPEAGDAPAPADPEDVAVVEYSARVLWRAFPYFAWRYGARGRAFGRSDAGYLATLHQLGEDVAVQQVTWLAALLAARGMPSLLLEYQLESLGRAAKRGRRHGASLLLAVAERMRRARLAVLSVAVGARCEELCRAAADGVSCRRGAGRLIAAAVADSVLGLGEHDEALVRWLSHAAPGGSAWSGACRDARALALAERGRRGSAVA
jgi:hypothetical protein